jgi:hypothetical protein
MTLTVERAPPFEPPIPPSLFTTLLFVILSDARTSVATERESKDLCTRALERCHEGIPTVTSFTELLGRPLSGNRRRPHHRGRAAL